MELLVLDIDEIEFTTSEEETLGGKSPSANESELGREGLDFLLI